MQPHTLGHSDITIHRLGWGLMSLSGLYGPSSDDNGRRLIREADATGSQISEIKVPARPLQVVLEEQGLTEVDFLSVDTEGSESAVLNSIDYAKTQIRLIALERNYASHGIPGMLRRNGFLRVFSLEWDDFYLNRDLREFTKFV